MDLVKAFAMSFAVACASVSAQTQSSSPGLTGIQAVQLSVEPVDDESRQCGLSDDGPREWCA